MSQLKTITVRVNLEEYNALVKQAKCANLSLNRFLIESATKPAPRNDRRMTDLMGQLCRLELLMQQATSLEALRRDIHAWRFGTMQLMEG